MWLGAPEEAVAFLSPMAPVPAAPAALFLSVTPLQISRQSIPRETCCRRAWVHLRTTEVQFRIDRATSPWPPEDLPCPVHPRPEFALSCRKACPRPQLW